MYKFILRRLLLLVPIIIGVTFIVFSIMSLTPSSPGRIVLGPMASEEAVEKLDHKFGYDKPFIIRYFDYMLGAIKGDLGLSYITERPVIKEIVPRFPRTLQLSLLSIICAAIIGIPIGILSAVKQYSAIDLISSATAIFLASIPGFWLGLMFILLFSVKLGWLPSYGIGTLKHIILPMLTLALPTAAAILRLTRSTMLETIRQDYMRTAKSKGATESRLIWKHALKNSLMPVITLLGMNFGILLGGAVLVEIVFAYPGLGTLIISAIRMKDIPQVMGSVIILATLFCIIMLLVDIIYAYMDPRIKAKFIN